MAEYESQVASAMERLADVGELIAGGLFACAASTHTKDLFGQRDMAAVLREDARTRYKDILRKLNKRQRDELERYIQGLCKGK